MILVITNMPDAESASRLAHTLIEQHAAACVNVLAPCTSVYHWQGQVETATEYPVFIKSTRDAYARIETLIRDEHPYELPEIISLPVDAALPEYLNWVNTETRLDKE